MKQLVFALPFLLLVACGSGNEDSNSDAAGGQADPQIAAQTMVVELATRNVSCGCALEAIGHCGNYIEINSQYVEIANGDEIGLGPMEWCGKEGVQAKSAGEIKDGKFVATTLVVD